MTNPATEATARIVIALCNGVRGLKFTQRHFQVFDINIALCNGVRGLKCWIIGARISGAIIALCNGVRGLKFLEDLLFQSLRPDRTL